MEERAICLNLLSALLDELEHLRVSVNSALEKVDHLIKTKVLEDIPTDRLKTDFLQERNFRWLGYHPLREFSLTLHALHDVEHCNGMLNRYENECRKLGLPEYGMNRLTDSGIPNDAKAVLESAATSLQTAEATIENTKNSIASSVPRLIPPWVWKWLAKRLEPIPHS